MNELGQLTDRDLLVRIDTKLEALEPRMKTVEDKVLALELRAARSSGMLSGAKLLWGILVSLPAGVLGAIVQANR